jgi:hypothetical protein
LTSRAVAPVRYRVWIAAVGLYFVASYPSQGVAYSWCGDAAQIVFVILGVVAALAILLLPRGDAMQYPKLIWIASGVLALTMLATLVAYANLTVVREFILLFVIAASVRMLASGELDLARAFIYVTVAALIASFLAVSMFYAHWLDWPSWSVERLGLAETNPLRTRQFNADFDFYLPLWMAVVPSPTTHGVTEQGFGLAFVRQSFVYIEPSDVWYAVAGWFGIALVDTKMPARTLCLVVLGLALALSFSVFGILVTVLAVVFAFAMAVGGRWLVAAAVLAILAILPFIPIYEWVQMIGSNKADELAFYVQNVTVLSDLTLLGHAASQKEQPISYGFLIVLYRYGMVGFAVMLCVSIAILWAAFRLLRDQAVLGWRRFPLFIACFTSVALLVKGGTIVPTMAALTLATALGIRQNRLDPLTRR